MSAFRRVLLAAASQAALAAPGAAWSFELTILHNNDGESRLLETGNLGSAAQFVTLVNETRAATANPVLTLSSGDNFLAGTTFNASLQNNDFYDARVLNAIGYDAIILGNHDFDFGPQVLADFISSPNFTQPVPFLSANLNFANEAALQALVTANRIAPSIVVEKNGEKIGVIGATTPQLPFISSPGAVQVNADVRAVVQGQIDALQGQGVNKIVLVSHLQSVQEDVALIGQLSGVDVAIAGGGDDLLASAGDALLPGDVANPANPYPRTVADADGRTVHIVTTSGEYKYLGRIDVEFDAAGEVIAIAEPQSGPIRNPSAATGLPDVRSADPTIQATVIAPVEASVAALEANVIAQSEVALDGRRGNFVNGQPGVRTEQTNLGSLVADSLLWQAQQLAASFGVDSPTIAIQNGGGIRNNAIIPAGDFTEKDTFDILPFANFVSVVQSVTPEQLKLLLENVVSRVEFTDGRFAQLAGVRIVYDLNGVPFDVDEVTGQILASGSRILSVVLDDGTVLVQDGQIVGGAPSIAIATIDFSARGGDQYPFPQLGLDFTTLGVTYQQALFNYVTQGLGGVISEDMYGALASARILQLVPEPATLGLFGLAFAALAARRRRA